MPFRKISEDIKMRGIWLYDNGYVPDDICEILDFSERSLHRWQHNLDTHGSVIPLINPSRGRPKLLRADMAHDIFTLLEESPELYLDEIQEWILLSHDVGISRSALDENLRDAGITHKLLRKAASERDEEAREAFSQYARDNWVAEQLVFVDETSKDERTIYRHYGRSVLG
ncbi:hypothetical protein DFH11DRAFT_1462219, partial [Phellopilus nigrolimitatus]